MHQIRCTHAHVSQERHKFYQVFEVFECFDGSLCHQCALCACMRVSETVGGVITIMSHGSAAYPIVIPTNPPIVSSHNNLPGACTKLPGGTSLRLSCFANVLKRPAACTVHYPIHSINPDSNNEKKKAKTKYRRGRQGPLCISTESNHPEGSSCWSCRCILA